MGIVRLVPSAQRLLAGADRLGTAGREYINQNFSWTSIERNILAMVDETGIASFSDEGVHAVEAIAQ